jgi:hypothetical protein
VAGAGMSSSKVTVETAKPRTTISVVRERATYARSQR